MVKLHLLPRTSCSLTVPPSLLPSLPPSLPPSLGHWCLARRVDAREHLWAAEYGGHCLCRAYVEDQPLQVGLPPSLPPFLPPSFLFEGGRHSFTGREGGREGGRMNKRYSRHIQRQFTRCSSSPPTLPPFLPPLSTSYTTMPTGRLQFVFRPRVDFVSYSPPTFKSLGGGIVSTAKVRPSLLPSLPRSLSLLTCLAHHSVILTHAGLCPPWTDASER